jgi:hypothetical protein
MQSSVKQGNRIYAETLERMIESGEDIGGLPLVRKPEEIRSESGTVRRRETQGKQERMQAAAAVGTELP